MPRNTAGTYSLPTGNPVVSGTVIQSSWANDTLSDVASALTDSLSRSGEGGMTAPLRIADGTVGAPGLAFSNETGSGLYRAAAGDYSLALLGSQIMHFQAGAVTVNGTLESQGNGTINGNLTVTGTAAITGNTTISAGYLRVSDGGSAASPSIQPGNDADTGVFWPAANTLGFATNGTEKMRITEAGNVGIGTNAPTYKLQLAGDAGGMNFRIDEPTSAYTLTTGIDDTSVYWSNNSASRGYRWIIGGNERMRIDSSGTVTVKGGGFVNQGSAGNVTMDDSGARLSFSRGSANYITAIAAGGSLHFGSNGTDNQMILAAGNLGIGTTPSGTYMLEVNGGASFDGNTYVASGVLRTSGGGSAAAPSIQPGNDADTGMYLAGTNIIGFATGGTSKMTIDASGQTNIFANVASYSSIFQNANAAPSGIRSHYSGVAPNGTTNVFFLASDTVGTKFTVRSNGGIANYSANNVNLSDRREKKDFEPSGDYLEKLCQIPVQKFRYINQATEDDNMSLGVIAQDVQAICPELVMESDWGNGEEGTEEKLRLSIYQTDLEYAMLRAIQELKAEIEALKTAK